MGRTFEEVKVRCKVILNDGAVLCLVEKSSSPTAAYEMIMSEIGDMEKAKAGRWLAILRRDHFEDYQAIISNRVTLSQHDSGKDNEHERDVH